MSNIFNQKAACVNGPKSRAFEGGKIIHLCWFSGDEYPPQIKKCIDSWAKVMPDYKVKVWTKEMALATGIDFVREAIEARKWAFAADAIRVYALYNDGGVYMDSDIFVKRRFDEFLTDKVVLFHEYHAPMVKQNPEGIIDSEGRKVKDASYTGCGIQAAFMISQPGQPYIKALLDYYCTHHFLREDGTYDMTISPSIFCQIAQHMLDYRFIDTEQHSEGVTIYPSKYVAGGVKEVTKDAFAVHCVAHSWYDSNWWENIKYKVKGWLVMLRL